MYTILIGFFIVTFYLLKVLNKQFNYKVYFSALFLIYLTIGINLEHFLKLDSFVFNFIIKIITFPIYREIKLGFVLLLIFSLLFYLNVNKLIEKFANFYFLFLIDVFDKNTVSQGFITKTILFGVIIGRQISIYLDLSVIKTIVLTTVFGCLSFFIIYIILIGFLFLGLYYLESWGNDVFTYLFKKTSPSLQQKLKSMNYRHKAFKTPQPIKKSECKNQQKRK